MDTNQPFAGDCTGISRPLTRAPAVRLKPARRRCACHCGRAPARPMRADKRWRLGGAPCLILRREKVPC